MKAARGWGSPHERYRESGQRRKFPAGSAERKFYHSKLSFVQFIARFSALGNSHLKEIITV